MLALLACLPAATVQLDAPVFPSISRLNSGAAIQELDGETWALGPGYKARLSGNQLEFLPALGQNAPRLMPLSLRVLELGRGGASIAAQALGAGQREGARLDRPIAAGVTEQLLATEQGLELSYLFESRPAGDGDLIVRLALESELPLVHSGPTGLEFSLPEIGGVTIGSVTGIDAGGHRETGELRVVQTGHQRVLELSLPDQFIDQAQFPLVLDPVIGAAFDVNSSGTGFLEAPDAIWSQAGFAFYVCWRVDYSTNASDLFVRRFDVSGNPLSPATLVHSENAPIIGVPQIAAFDGTDRLLIAWSQLENNLGDAFARSFRTNLTSFSNVVTIQSVGFNQLIGVDIAGRRDPSADGMAIWSVRTGNQATCRSRRISVPLNGDPTLGVVFQLEAGDNSNVPPRLARFGDIQGRFFAGWCNFFADIRLARLASTGAPIQPFSIVEVPHPIFEISVGNSLDLDQTAGGTEFLLSFSYFSGNDVSRLYATTLDWSDVPSATGNFSVKKVLATNSLSPNNKNFDAGTALLLGQSACLSMNTLNGIPVQNQARFARFNKDNGSLISVVSTPLSSSFAVTTRVPAFAARPFTGGTDADQMLYVYQNGDDLFVQPAEVFGTGLVADLGGNCGSTNSISLSGTPVVGHPGLSVGMDAATPGTLAAVLNIAYNPVPIFCGACTWNPFQTTLVTPVQGTTVIPLNLPVPLAAPWLGLSLELQWTLVGGPNSPCALSPGIELSNRLRLTFGE